MKKNLLYKLGLSGLGVVTAAPVVALAASCGEELKPVTQEQVNAEQLHINALQFSVSQDSITDKTSSEFTREVQDEPFSVTTASMLKIAHFEPHAGFSYTYSHPAMDGVASTVGITITVHSAIGSIVADNAVALAKEFFTSRNLTQSWTPIEMKADDVFLQVFNSEAYGLLPVSYTVSGNLGLLDHSANPTQVAVKTFEFSKNDFLHASAQRNRLNYPNSKAQEVHDFLAANPGKYYFATVTNTTPERLDNSVHGQSKYVDGVFAINLYEMPAQSGELTGAISTLKNRFQFDTDLIQRLGGEYYYAPMHDFVFDEHNSHNFVKTHTSVKGTDSDRINEDSLKAWTALGPIQGQDSTGGLDPEITRTMSHVTLKDVGFVKDAKTNIFNIVINVKVGSDNAMENYQTIYIPVPEATSWATDASAPVTDAQKDEIVNWLFANYKPQRIIDTFKALLKPVLGFLGGIATMDQQHLNSIKRAVLEISGAAQRLIDAVGQNDDLLKTKLRAALDIAATSRPEFNIPTFLAALKNMRPNFLSSLGPLSLMTAGGKTFSIFVFMDNFFKIIDQQVLTAIQS